MVHKDPGLGVLYFGLPPFPVKTLIITSTICFVGDAFYLQLLTTTEGRQSELYLTPSSLRYSRIPGANKNETNFDLYGFSDCFKVGDPENKNMFPTNINHLPTIFAGVKM